MRHRFKDRADAGHALAGKLGRFSDDPATVVCALPRGGVVLGVEVARALRAPLDLLIPRKIGHPQEAEYAVAAVTETGEPVIAPEEESLAQGAWFEAAVRRERREAARRRKAYLTKRDDGRRLDGKTALIVDDGVATGLTMRAAIGEARALGATRVVIAVPFGPGDVLQRLAREVDEIVTVFESREYAGSVGAYYDVFPQVTDEEVIRYMKSFVI